MTWNSRWTSDPAERGAALRAEREAQDAHARRRQADMANRDKSPTGVVRGRYDFDGARTAVGSLNRKVDEAIDEVAAAFERQRHVEAAAGMTRQDDAKRAPILDGRKAVG